MKKHLSTIVTVLALVIAVVSQFRISNLQSEMRQMENRLNNSISTIKLKLVIHGDLAKLRNIKGSQTSTAAYQEAFCGFARSQGILLVLSDGKVVRFSCFQFFKHAVNGVLVWSLGRQGSTGFHRRRTP